MKGWLKMKCIAEQIVKEHVNSIGASKEILVESYNYVSHGETGKTYTYKMSPDRFERPIKIAYNVTIEDEATKESFHLITLTYYDFVDYELKHIIGTRRVEEAARVFSQDVETIWNVVLNELQPIQSKIREEFSCSEEYITNKKNREIIETYKKKKLKFSREYGIDAMKYDRCYNVFGEVVNQEYLNKIHEMVKDREKYSENSRKKHKQAWRNFTGGSGFFSGGGHYKEDEKEVLSKFYKVLAKKYHPDANPNKDTSKEMTLLNRLKKEWNV